MRTFGTTFLLLLLALAVAAPVSAQQSAGAQNDHQSLSFEALDAAVASHETQANLQRAQLDQLLAGDAVRAVAEERGIDMKRVAAAAAGLSDAQVNAATPMVATIAAAPGTITIGVGTLIVVLLILILVT